MRPRSSGGGLVHRVRLCGLVAEQCGAAVVLVEAVEDWCGVGEGLLIGAHHVLAVLTLLAGLGALLVDIYLY